MLQEQAHFELQLIFWLHADVSTVIHTWYAVSFVQIHMYDKAI